MTRNAAFVDSRYSLDQLALGTSVAWQWTRFAARTAGYASVSCMFGPFPHGRLVCQELFRRWCAASIAQMGIEVRATGAEITGACRPAVLVANHLSALDIPVLGAVLQGDYRWVAKRELLRIPFVGWHLRLAGHVPVDRGGGRRAHAELDRRLGQVFAEQGSVLLFPEGTRSEDGALQPFKLGAFFASVKHNIPVIPIALSGTEQITKKGALTLDPSASRTVRIRILDPIVPPRAEDDERRARTLRAATREAIVAALDDLRGAAGAAERPTISV